MLEQRIQQHFFDSADLKYQVAETLARPILDASSTLLGALTAGGKVLVAGLGDSAADAHRFVAGLVGGFERDRPGLAALTLAGDPVLACALAHEGSGGWAAQLQVLGNPGDVLVLLSAEPQPEALKLMVAAAHDKDLNIVYLSGRDAAGVPDLLQETDVHIAIPHDRPARVRELHALALHCLLDAVDVQLLGEQESA